MTQFLYNTYPVNLIIDEAGPQLLLRPNVTEAFEACGYFDDCDMDIRSEVSWAKVVSNWELPVEEVRSPTNPHRMGESPVSYRKRKPGEPCPNKFIKEDEAARTKGLQEAIGGAFGASPDEVRIKHSPGT